jgi:hypothetical protein
MESGELRMRRHTWEWREEDGEEGEEEVGGAHSELWGCQSLRSLILVNGYCICRRCNGGVVVDL